MDFLLFLSKYPSIERGTKKKRRDHCSADKTIKFIHTPVVRSNDVSCTKIDSIEAFHLADRQYSTR